MVSNGDPRLPGLPALPGTDDVVDAAMDLGADPAASSRGARAREAPPASSPAHTPPHKQQKGDHSELQSDFAAFKQEIRDAVRSESNNTVTKIEGIVEQLGNRVEQRLSGQIREVNDQVAVHSEILSTHEAELATQKREMAKLRTQFEQVLVEVAAASSASPPDVPFDPSYAREIDGSILRVRAKETAKKTDVLQALQDLVELASLPKDSFDLQGDAVGQTFVAKFSGQAGLACKRASKTRAALREPSGKWRQLETKPENPASATNLYVDPDKNPQQIACERALKKLRELLQADFSSQTFFARKDDATIFLPGWRPVAHILSPAKGEYLVKWNQNEEVARQAKAAGVGDKLYTAMADPTSRATWV